jgi:large subunit ribosomal protein L4e
LATVQVYDLAGDAQTSIERPEIFDSALRPDVIKRAVLALQSHRYQPQGRDLLAGKRTSAESIGTGHGISRLPRVKGSRYPRAQQGAFAPNTVGGRTTHPPTAEKRIRNRFNRKERRLAIRSAIAATGSMDVVTSRGHATQHVKTIPLVVTDGIESIMRTREARQVFQALGISPDLERVTKSQKIRAGKGTKRGRKRRHGVGPLLVVSTDNGVSMAVGNLLGVDVVAVEKLNVELLAPGTVPGRLTVWSSSAFEKLDALFLRG